MGLRDRPCPLTRARDPFSKGQLGSTAPARCAFPLIPSGEGPGCGLLICSDVGQPPPKGSGPEVHRVHSPGRPEGQPASPGHRSWSSGQFSLDEPPSSQALPGEPCEGRRFSVCLKCKNRNPSQATFRFQSPACMHVVLRGCRSKGFGAKTNE